MSTQGVDYAAGTNSFGAILHAAGKIFAMRYLAPDWRGLTAPEYIDLRTNGVDVGFISEGSGSDALGGFAAGVAAATRAQAQINANHWPNLPIYFAVDFDARGSQLTLVDEFLNGAASVVTRARTGVYGSATVIDHCRVSGSAVWFFQTYAWSGGILALGVHVYQYNNGQAVNGHTVDLCLALATHTGFASDGGTTPIVERIDSDMPINIVIPDHTVATLGGTWGTIWSDASNFSYKSNIAAYGEPVPKNMTRDELTTVVNEANARGAAYSKVTVDAPDPADVAGNIDIGALATAIAGALPHDVALTKIPDIIAAIKTVFATVGAS